MPAVAAAAGWMDTFKLPMREIRKKYTRSELALMAWDSREKSANLSKRYRSGRKLKDKADDGILDVGPNNGVIETKDSYELPDEINNGVAIPKRFIDKDGEINLSKVTGPEAVRYLRAIGINIMARL